MKKLLENSIICGVLSQLCCWIINVYNCSRLKIFVQHIRNIYSDSYFGKIAGRYENNEPYFFNSKISSLGKRVINKVFDGLSYFANFIAVKIFRHKNFDDFVSDNHIRFRAASFIIILALAITLLKGNATILLLAIAIVFFVWLVTSSYEVMLYVLALYAFVDFIFRNYIVSLSSVWDELFLIAMFCMWVYKSVRHRKDAVIKVAPLDTCIWIYIGVFFVLMMISPGFEISIEGFRAIVQYLLWYFVVLQLLKDENSVKKLLCILVGVVGILAIYGVYQYIIGVEMPSAWVESSESIRTRVYSIFTSPNIFGSLLVLVIPIAFSMAINSISNWKRACYLGLVAFMLLSLLFTYSRGAWIGAICAIGVYVLLRNKKLVLPAIMLGIAVLIFVPSISDRLFFMFSSDYLSSSMKGGRLIRWLTAFQILQEHPIAGLGLGRFGGAVAANHSLSAVVNGEIVETFYMDNYYMKIAAESGIIGLIAFIWLMYQVMMISLKTINITKDKTMKELEIGVLAGMTGVIFHNLVENVFEVPLMTSMFWMLAAVMMHMWYLNYNNGRNDKIVKN